MTATTSRLIGYLRERQACDRILDAAPDRQRILLDPTGLRERDRHWPRRPRHHSARVVEQQHLRVRRALINREDDAGAPSASARARAARAAARMPSASRPKCSSRNSGEPVGANTPGTPSMRIRVGMRFDDHFGHGAAEAAEDGVLLDGHDGAAARRLFDALAIDGSNRRQVQHRGADPVRLEQPGGLERARPL